MHADPFLLARFLPFTELSSCSPGCDKVRSEMSEALPVLVVEDEEILLCFLKTALERGGVKVVGASSGAEALNLLEQGEFAGVVSDLRMPDKIGGAEVFDWVRQNRPKLSSRFLFITGNAHDSYAIEIQERTGALFIEKPFRIGLLIELISKVIAREQVHV
jgi:CheY-like chemotaxis protein